jgi:nitrite reductase/ring-hydroxylating ferredoxin subunit
MSETGFRTLGKSADVPEGYVMPYYLEDRKGRVSVARVSGRLYAFDDLSTSDRAPLSSGLLIGVVIMSPCDGARFDISTGKPAGGPATAPLATYGVREREGLIEVALDGSA